MNKPSGKSATPGNIIVGITVVLLVVVNIIWLGLTDDSPQEQADAPSSAIPGELNEFTFAVSTCENAYPTTQSLVYLPPDYESDGADKDWPVVLFLHGSWHRGDNLDLVRESGIPRLIEDGQDYPFILVAPQCPVEERWHMEDLSRLLDAVEEQFRVDQDQIHVTGFQLGGYGTWELAGSDPDRFATAVPFGGHRDKIECRGPAPEWMTQLHLWYFYAASDEVTNSSDSTRSIQTVWDSGTCVRMTDASEGTRDIPQDWTRIYQRNEIIEWMLGKRRKMRHFLRWPNQGPAPGRQVQGELCAASADGSAKPLIQFQLYMPPAEDPENPIVPQPLLMYLHGKDHAADDPELLLDSPLPQAIRNGVTPPFLVLSPQCPVGSDWDFALLEDLRDQLDVQLAIIPHQQFITGVGEGAAAAWDFAVRDPFNFSAMALIDYQPDGPFTQQAHRLINLPKHFYSLDQSVEPVVDYCQLVSDKTYQKAAPDWTVSEDDSTEALAERLIASGELFEWFAEQPANPKRAAPRYRPLGVPYHLKMASPEVVDLFERHEYRFETHHQEMKPFHYSLHKPTEIESGRQYPLLVWIHGHGASEHSLEFGELQWFDAVIPDPADTQSHDFFICAMQCPSDRQWNDGSGAPGERSQSDEPLTAVFEITEKVVAEHPIDPGRITLVGISSGSTACWEMLKRHPGFFAAVSPIAGSGASEANFGEDMSGERIWAFKGMVDGGIDTMRKTIHHVRGRGADARLTEVLRDAHFTWPEAFFDHHLLSWLLEQRRDDLAEQN